MPCDPDLTPADAPGRGPRFARVLRHPVTLLLFALALFGAGGALVDSVTGPEGEASQGCVSPAADWRPELRAAMLADAGNRRLRAEWRARRAYDRVWRRAAPLLGAGGTEPPRMRFVGGHEVKPDPRAAMWVGPDEVGCRTIFIVPGQLRALGKVEGNLRSRDAALTRTLHETAHYFQSDAVLSDVTAREVGACAWAGSHGPWILRTRKASRSVAFAQWRDRDQFGDKYGGDPQTFGWPGQADREAANRLPTACGGASRSPSRSRGRCGLPPGR